MKSVLKLLEENARYTNEQLAIMIGESPEFIETKINQLEQDGIIRGYKAIIDREKLSEEYVIALIEIKVTPKRDLGFDEVAEKISEYPEVEDVYLMSGGYDLALFLTGKNFKDIALFVSQRLAVMDSVVSTATHFVLSQYKEKGIIMHDTGKDERGNASL